MPFLVSYWDLSLNQDIPYQKHRQQFHLFSLLSFPRSNDSNNNSNNNDDDDDDDDEWKIGHAFLKSAHIAKETFLTTWPVKLLIAFQLLALVFALGEFVLPRVYIVYHSKCSACLQTIYAAIKNKLSYF